MPGRNEFARHVAAILERFFRQNGRAQLPATEVAALADGLWTAVERVGLPRPLAQSEQGAPGKLPDGEVERLLDPVLAALPAGSRESLTGPAAQLLKACLYPEFRKCRDSFREISPDGACRRQELPRAQARLSGSHCVDCPHWLALTPEQHTRYLAREWKGGAEEFNAHREVFLPEDFRALRIFVHSQAQAAE
ncbi:MAG: hypothetical protein JWM88_1013 [Verrucomicrobia bacterium]|nr:hypothetical protein [Verrucomicrobiota bacterium]